jgi:hypothetical protein
VSITGCASSRRIETPPEKLAVIKTIAVEHVPEPAFEVEIVRKENMIPLPLGPVLIMVKVQSGGEQNAGVAEQLGQLVTKNSNVPLGKILEQGIVSRLQSKGFASSIAENQTDFHADASLVLGYKFYGFINDPKAGTEEVKSDPTSLVNITQRNRIDISDYYPALWVKVEVLGKHSKEIIYRGFHASGWKPPKSPKVSPNWYPHGHKEVPLYGDWIHTPLPETVTVGSVEELAADPQKIIAKFREMAEIIATSIVNDITKGGQK